jgi:hypothetical protein
MKKTNAIAISVWICSQLINNLKQYICDCVKISRFIWLCPSYCNVLGLVNTEQNGKDVLIPGCQNYVMYLSLSYVLLTFRDQTRRNTSDNNHSEMNKIRQLTLKFGEIDLCLTFSLNHVNKVYHYKNMY